MKITRLFFLFFLFASILGVNNGCATLPDVSEAIDDVPASQKTHRITSANGLLTPHKSKAIMDRLKRSVDQTDVLGRHLCSDVQGYSGRKAQRQPRNVYHLDGDVGIKFADLLIRKQAEGVQVNLIFDSMGSFTTSDTPDG